jgi:hypothetical protein
MKWNVYSRNNKYIYTILSLKQRNRIVPHISHACRWGTSLQIPFRFRDNMEKIYTFNRHVFGNSWKENLVKKRIKMKIAKKRIINKYLHK